MMTAAQSMMVNVVLLGVPRVVAVYTYSRAIIVVHTGVGVVQIEKEGVAVLSSRHS